MPTKIKLRLNLNKVNTKIEVRYNTFEKATFDQYLMGCLFLNSTPDSAEQYIDEITGEGSLNEHFKKLYDEISELENDTVKNIVNSSLYPTIKIDESAYYTYYPELNISFYRGKKYDGDFKDKVIENPKLITNAENIIRITPLQGQVKNSQESYDVEFQKDSAILYIDNARVEVSRDFLSSHIVLAHIDYYAIERMINFYEIDENNKWIILDQSLINSVVRNNLGFFNNNKEYCFIKEYFASVIRFGEYDQIKLYSNIIYRYDSHGDIANDVAKYLVSNKQLRGISDTLAFNLLHTGVEDTLQQNIINERFLLNNNPNYINEAMNLIKYNNVIEGWGNDILMRIINKQNNELLRKIYKYYPDLKYEYEHLIRIPKEELRTTDAEILLKIKEDRRAKIDKISKIIGVVSVKALRESAKNLKADNDTREFTKLIKEMMAHRSSNLETLSNAALDKEMDKAIRLQQLAEIIEEKVNKLSK